MEEREDTSSNEKGHDSTLQKSDDVSAVMDAAQRRWQALLVGRLAAAQLALPDVPLVSAQRQDDDLQRLRQQSAS